MHVQFEWDEAKRRANPRKHRIDFFGIDARFLGETVTIVDDRFEYGEERLVTFGLLQGRVIAVVHTETDEVIRIFSARKATKREETSYFSAVAD